MKKELINTFFNNINVLHDNQIIEPPFIILPNLNSRAIMEQNASESYRRDLVNEEKQAYEGAKMFYYGVLPLSIVGLIFFVFFLYEDSNQVIQQNIRAMILYIALTILTYIASVYFYIKCNKIQTFPASANPSSNQMIAFSQIQLSERKNELNLQTQLSSQDTSQLHQSQFLVKPKKHFCRYCQKICEYRTKHCRKCRTCIQRFDHHCFWLGNCVGRHNHRQFYLFLLTQSLNNLFELQLISMVKDCSYSLDFQLHILVWIIIYLMLLTSFGFLCFTGYLAIYHTMLIALSLTTWEQMKREKISYLKYLRKGYNPFSIGLINNFKKFFTEQTRATVSNVYLQEWDSFLPTFQEAKLIKPGFNLIDNEYYSCC